AYPLCFFICVHLSIVTLFPYTTLFRSLIMVVVARNITRKKQGKAFGFIGSIVALGEGLGPSIGGIIAHYIHWSYLLILPMITIVTIPFLIKVMVPGKSTKNTLD